MSVNPTRRIKIVTGFCCNADCMFCYYKDRLKEPNFSTKSIQRDIDFALKHGIRSIDFSGGEPTIHPDLAYLISYAREKGVDSVCIITNGLVLKDKAYYKSLADAGLNETLFSLQGCDEPSHDAFVNMKGAFRRLVKAMENAKELGISVRTNTVVHGRNYKDLINVSKLAVSFKPVQVNFITVNDWAYAKDLVNEFLCSYTLMAPHLKEACDFLKSYLDNINIRYIPFCLMLGYEKFVCDHQQVKYDPYEWRPRVRIMLEKHYHWYHTAGLIGLGCFTSSAYKKLFRLKVGDFLDDCIVAAIRHYGYRKNRQCLCCRYRILCDGLEKEYVKYLGMDELKRVEGELIRAPYFFREHLF